MGGLVARNFTFKNLKSSLNNSSPLLISIVTPWDGHAAAKSGVEHLPQSSLFQGRHGARKPLLDDSFLRRISRKHYDAFCHNKSHKIIAKSSIIHCVGVYFANISFMLAEA